MSLLSVHEVSYSHSHGALLFGGLSFDIDPADRIGLAGPNGCGKTTLLRLVSGELSPASGEIVARRGVRISLLPQEPDATHGITAIDSLLALRPEVLALRESLSDFEGRLDEPFASLQYAELLYHYNDCGGYELEAAAERVLDGLGLDARARQRDLATLSGGERVRVALARCLLSGADLLLLDEPTNHLDLAAREWLETYLENLSAAAIVVSHDRAFLNRVTRRTLALERGELMQFAGNYDFYREQRELRVRRQWRQFEAAERRNAAAKRAAERRLELSNRVATAPRGVRSGNDFYGRKAAKVARTARILKERRLHEEETPKPWEEQPIPELSFSNVPESGEFMVRVHKLSKTLDGVRLFHDLSFHVRRGERLSVRGPNGSGKTTLLRVLCGLTEQDEGEIELASRVKIGYYAQSGENLNAELTPLEICRREMDDETTIRTLLGCLRLAADRVTRPIATLSAGERSKVALVRLLLSPVNLLLLDEPTNHLEIEAIEAVDATLQQFPGAIVFVTHDRSLDHALADTFIDLSSA